MVEEGGNNDTRWTHKKMAPAYRGHFSIVVPVAFLLVVPVAVTPDDYSVVTIMVPAAMEPSVMAVECNARPAIVVTVAIVSGRALQVIGTLLRD